MIRAAWLLLAVCAFVAGVWVGGGAGRVEQATPPPCRPSNSHLLSDRPAVLFWGNSLAFDHDWAIAGQVTVNCALQGLTAQRAAELTPLLPQMDFDTIVLVFGTVELLRDIDDPTPFRHGLNAVLETLRHRHPGARVIVLGIPGGDGWRYAGHPLLDPLNRVLQGLAGTEFLDASQVLAGLPADARSHDGVHPGARSYGAIDAALNAVLAADQPETGSDTGKN